MAGVFEVANSSVMRYVLEGVYNIQAWLGIPRREKKKKKKKEKKDQRVVYIASEKRVRSRKHVRR